jgi:hypothetical protein
MLENPESHSTNGRLLYHEAKNYHLLGVWRKSIEGVIQFLERGAVPRRGVIFSMARLCRPSFSHSTDRRHKPTDPCGKKVYHIGRVAGQFRISPAFRQPNYMVFTSWSTTSILSGVIKTCLSWSVQRIGQEHTHEWRHRSARARHESADPSSNRQSISHIEQVHKLLVDPCLPLES